MRDLLVRRNKFVQYVFGLIFPPKCIFCSSLLHPLADMEICTSCYDKIPFIKGKICTICGKPIDKPFGPLQCLDCRDRKTYFLQNISPCEYSGIVRAAIVRFKFYGKKRYAHTLACLMLDCLKRRNLFLHDAIVIYTPLHKAKLRERGFNQARLLAKTISKGLGCTLKDDILLKIKDTPPQSSLPRRERIQNLRGAFKVRGGEQIAGRNILLVDDVYTTGATVNECARMLKGFGAKDIYVVTAAIGRGMN